MAFIIVADNKSQEIERRELITPLILGRSPECDLPVRDILLSRKHCVIERLGEAWVIADLGSKNGTRVNGELINRHMLNDCDLIRIGRTRIAFREGPFIPAPPEVKRHRQRPVDPIEAMQGTIAGFRFKEEEEEALDQRVLESFPRPKPRPQDPRAYQSEKVQAMVAQMASTYWDAQLVEPGWKIEADAVPVLERETIASAKPQANGKRRPTFDTTRVTTMLFVGICVMLTSISVWVISWSW